jgi:DNA-binding NarL/FixJ family response regulator
MRILLADSQPRVRFALRVLLRQQQGMEVSADVEDAPALWQRLAGEPADLLLLDAELPGLAEAGGPAELHRRYPDLPLVVLTVGPTATRNGQCAGATVCVSKSDPPERLLAAIGSATRDKSAP